MEVGAKVCDLTEDLLWYAYGLYVGILTPSLKYINEPYSRIWSCSFHESRIGRDIENEIKVDSKTRPNLRFGLKSYCRAW